LERILITGGAGSMGKELSFILAEKGYKIRVFDIPQANFTGLKEKGIEIFEGDITDIESVKNSLKDVDMVVHLAAILPPLSENNKELAVKVNVDGTKNLVDAIENHGNKARLIFSSSVATYGDTTDLEPPVTVDTKQRPNTNYSETKVKCEKHILNSDVDYTILRISGMVLAALLDPPEWPFTAEQRVEMVFRDDVVSALVAAVEVKESTNKILIVAGGKTWQMKGHEFVEEFFKILDIEPEDAEYAEKPVYSDWYDTEEAQNLLNYQETPFPVFLGKLQSAIDEVLG
jgi:nucleoside-diphosphate-sugar epimerase